MKSVVLKITALALGLFSLASATYASGKAGLRINCDGVLRNSKVMINEKPMGSCPVDLEVPAGRISLRVHHPDLGETLTFFEDFEIAPGGLRRVIVDVNSMKHIYEFSDYGETPKKWLIKKFHQIKRPEPTVKMLFSIENNILKVGRYWTTDGSVMHSESFRVPNLIHSQEFEVPLVAIDLAGVSITTRNGIPVLNIRTYPSLCEACRYRADGDRSSGKWPGSIWFSLSDNAAETISPQSMSSVFFAITEFGGPNGTRIK